MKLMTLTADMANPSYVKPKRGYVGGPPAVFPAGQQFGVLPPNENRLWPYIYLLTDNFSKYQGAIGTIENRTLIAKLIENGTPHTPTNFQQTVVNDFDYRDDLGPLAVHVLDFLISTGGINAETLDFAIETAIERKSQED